MKCLVVYAHNPEVKERFTKLLGKQYWKGFEVVDLVETDVTHVESGQVIPAYIVKFKTSLIRYLQMSKRVKKYTVMQAGWDVKPFKLKK